MSGDAGKAIEWRKKRGKLGRRKLDRVHGRRIIWPAESPANRETFDRWYAMALRVAHDTGASVDTLAAFPLVILYNSGQIKRSNAELADLAGGISERSVIRHLQQYEAIGIIAFERGWRLSPKSKKPIETRAIVLCWPDRGAYESDSGGHSDPLETDDSGGHQKANKSDSGGHSQNSQESDSGGHRNGDSGGHGTTSVTSGDEGRAHVQPSGGRPEDRPAAGRALPVPSASRRSSQSRSAAHDITAEPDGTNQPMSPIHRAKNAYARMKDGEDDLGEIPDDLQHQRTTT